MDKQDVFTELLRLHKDRVYRFALRLSGNLDDAMDLTQEAFLRALRNLDRYDSARPFEAWIYTILNHLYLNGLDRYETKHVLSFDRQEAGFPAPEAASPEDPPEKVTEREELRGIVQEALGRLPYIFRAPLILCDMEGMDYEQISRALLCPVNTVRTRIHRARKLFRSRMAPYLREGKVL